MGEENSNHIEIQENEGPARVFTESFAVRIIRGHLHLYVRSGDDVYSFVLPLILGKALARAIKSQIEEVEKKTGQKIEDARLSTDPYPSPISQKDLSEDDEK